MEISGVNAGAISAGLTGGSSSKGQAKALAQTQKSENQVAVLARDATASPAPRSLAPGKGENLDIVA